MSNSHLLRDGMAIIGISCRFPGSRDHHQFWSNLRQGVAGVSFFSDDELAAAGVSRELIRDPHYVKAGYPLADVELFDAEFFGYVGSEAELIDPQQRLFLECAWEALEDAGYAPRGSGAVVGVFAGCRMSTYFHRVFTGLRPGGTAEAFQALIGNDKDYLSSRVSYKLDLRGPSVNVQTACSSSLVATHQACESLRAGECDMAVAGGVAVAVPHRTGYLYQPGMILSPDGYCRTFDAEANGTVFSNGVGAVVLKRLEDAVADGDGVYAVVRGSSVNNDGAGKVGYTAPGPEGQAAVIHEALGMADVNARSLDYVEAHGTGTAIGDPVELTALTKVFRRHTQDRQFCAIGSVKTNIGHADAAAGIASLIKTALALDHQELPPSLHFTRPNPAIDFDAGPFFVNAGLRPWPRNERPRRAGISSFGIGGTNAHLVLEEAPQPPAATRHRERPSHLLTLSARNPTMLRELAGRFAEYLAERPETSLADCCFTANASRSSAAERLAVVADSVEELSAELAAFAGGERPPAVLTGGVEDNGRGRAIPTGGVAEPPEPVPADLGRDERRRRLTALGQRYVTGAAVELRALYGDQPPHRLHLPPSPFQRRRYWRQAPPAHPDAFSGEPVGHALLSARLATPLAHAVFSCRLDRESLALYAEHRVHGKSIAPATLFFELAHAAARLSRHDEVALRGVELRDMLVLDQTGQEPELQVVVDRSDDADESVRVFSSRETAPGSTDWTLHARASLVRRPAPTAEDEVAELSALRAGCGEAVDVEEYYAHFQQLGFDYGPAFRGLTELWRAPSQSLLRVSLGQNVSDAGYHWHPALLDACLHGVMAAAAGGRQPDRAFIPVACSYLELDARAPRRLWCHARLAEPVAVETRSFAVDLRLFDDGGCLLGRIDGLRLRHARPELFAEARDDRRTGEQLCYQVGWQPAARPPARPPEAAGAWLILGDDGGAGDDVAGRLRKAGATCSVVHYGDGGAHTKLAVPAQVEELLHGLRQAAAPAAPPPLGAVIHLWSLDVAHATDLEEARHRNCISVLHLVQGLRRAGLQEMPRLVMVTRGAQAVTAEDQPDPAQAPLWGLRKVVANEHPELAARIIDLDPEAADPEPLWHELTAGDGEDQVAWRGGRRWVARLRRLAAPGEPGAYAHRLALPRPGVDNLVVEALQRRPPAAGEVEVELAASSLNFRDLMLAMGIYPGEATELGSDGAGRVVAVGPGVDAVHPGDAVLVSTYGCLRSHVTVPAELVQPIPRRFSLAQAAALPVVFSTAWYALHQRGRIRAGSRVLIHAAAGGVGQAALQICRLAGAEVLATAGSPRKRSFLSRQGVRLVMDSRSTDFAEQVLAATGGRGVDVVLNSLSGESIAASLRVVAEGGCFLEIGKAGIWSPEQVREQRPDVAYHVVDLVAVGREQPELLCNALSQVVAACDQGELEPLPIKIFPCRRAMDAFRYLVEARQIGKIVLAHPLPAGGEEDLCSPEHSYLVTGGLGDLGLELAEWLIRQGARHLVLLDRRPPAPAAVSRLERWRSDGVTVRTPTADVADEQALAGAFSELSTTLPPLRGVFHLAGVLDDDLLLRLDRERFARVMRPKVEGAWNLHRLTRGPELDYFVLFSSTAAVFGPPGQGNYAAANAYLDALARYRRCLGLPALSINWGAWAETGVVARMGLAERLRRHGIRSFSLQTGFDLLTRLLRTGVGNVAVMDVDWPQLRRQFGAWGETPLYADLAADQAVQEDERRIAPGSPPAGEARLRAELRAAPGEQRTALLRTALLRRYLRERIATLLQVNEERLSDDADLLQIGVDSLVALDLFQSIEKDLGLRSEQRTLFENPTIGAMAERFAEAVAAVPEGDAGGDDAVESLPAVEPDPAAKHEPFNLGDLQQAYWVGRTGALELGNVACHVYLELETRDLDLERYRQAWQRLIAHHDMLRAVILPDARQRILARVPALDVQVTDARELPVGQAESQALALRERMSHEVLPVESWPLFKVAVTRLPGGRDRLHLSLDLLIADLHSMNLLMGDLARLYADPARTLRAPTLSFRDYVLAQAELRAGAAYRRSRAYWLGRLETLPPAPQLPLAISPSQLARPRFVRHAARLSRQRWAGLQQRASAAGLTPSGILLAAYAEVLAAWSRHPAFTINVTLFHRLPVHPQINELVGEFTSVTLLAVAHDGNVSFGERAGRVQRQLWDDIDHRFYNGVEVVREWVRTHDRGGGGIMPVVYTSTLGLGGEQGTHPALTTFGRVVYNITQTPQVWIDHQVREEEGELSFNWDAVDELFPAGLVDAMFAAYRRLLTILADDEQAWQRRELPLLPADQLARRRQANATQAPVSGELLHTLFAASLEQRPDEIAVISGERSLSYLELAQRAGEVAHRLRDGGSSTGELVAVVMDKGWEEVVAVLGILAAGGAYLPIDASVPAQRLQQLLRDAGIRRVLTQSWLDRLAWPEELERWAVDQLPSGGEQHGLPEPVQRPTDPAYVIYTSGSTGRPKGVMIDHRGAVNTILAVNRLFEVSAGDRVLALSRLSFDLSVWDIFGLLAAGGTIVVPDRDQLQEPGHWCELMGRHRVTVWNSVPALLQMLVEHTERRPEKVPERLRLTLLSGDWIPLTLPDRLRALVPAVTVIGLGGATEASIWSNYFPVHGIDPEWRSIPYGRPLPNQVFYVLNDRLQDCPDWVPGHLYIGGLGVAQGYLNDRERTAQQFLTHPRTGERLYATGDLGRYRDDGNLEFLGREDLQVKIHGHRIELGEIEATLTAHPQVAQAVVVTVGEARAEKALAAFVVLDQEGERVTEEMLRQFLADRLPAYMLPTTLELLPELPLTAVGKVDRKRLVDSRTPLSDDDSEMTAPRTATEEIIAAVLRQVLQRERVSTGSRFFELGISSLDLVTIQNQLQDRIGREVSVLTLLEHSTISGLAAHLSAQGGIDASVQRGRSRAERRQRQRSGSAPPEHPRIQQT